MAYVDLYADASLYFPLNNNLNYTLTSGQQNGLIGTLAPVFVADAPPNTGSTHSLRISGYGTATGQMQAPVFKQLTSTGPGRTVTFWFKITKSDGTAQALGESLGSNYQILTDRLSGETSVTEDVILLSGGTYSLSRIAGDAKVAGTINEVTVSTGTAGRLTTSTVGNTRIIPGIWNHIAFVDVVVGSTLHRAIYINGACSHFQITTNKSCKDNFGGGDAISNSGLSPIWSTTTNDTSIKRLAHYAIWNRALTKSEIREQAFYGLQTTQSYEDYIVSENPVYFTTLNNANKATDPQVLGSAGSTWGPLADDAANILVAQEGYPTGAGWGLQVGATDIDNYSDTTSAGIRQGFSQLQATGEYTFEAWFKAQPQYTSANQSLLTFTTTNASGSNLNQGHLTFRNVGFGRYTFILPNKSGATTFSQQTTTSTYTLNPSSTAVPDIGPGTFLVDENNNQIGGNFNDGKWHHIVFRQSNTKPLSGTAGQFAIQVFIDGFQTSGQTLTNTSGWITPSTFIDFVRTGTNATSGAASPLILLDNIALYGRCLNDDEVMEHFVAGYNFVQAAPANPVKYWDGSAWVDSSAQKVWNGTAWIDWTKSYWDGTQWVSI